MAESNAKKQNAEVAAKKQKDAKKQNKIVRFFKEIKSEIKKVTWPTRKQVINNTAVVIAVVVIIGIIIFAFDQLFQWGIFELLLKRGK